MIDWRITLRRWSLIALAVVSSGTLLHGQLSTMLVERGDALSYTNAGAAAQLYRRALWFDRANAVAVDRLLMRAVVSHDPLALRSAERIGRSALAQHDNATLRMDYALVLQVERRYAQAATEFSIVASATSDPRAYLFAADDLRRIGSVKQGHLLLLRARRLAPSFHPLLAAIARSGNPR
jgi:hypothetical protein